MIRRRKLRSTQWLLLTVFITLSFCGTVLYNNNLFKQSDRNNNNNNLVFIVKTSTQSTVASFSLAPLRHVTKSLTELGKMDEINRHVLFLNQIPNCGAEILIFLMQKMQGFNNYRHVRLKSAKTPRLSKVKEEAFVYDFFDRLRDAAVPLSFDKQVYFMNFTAYDKQSPTFINIIRDPADKFVSRRKRGGHDHISECFRKNASGQCYSEKIRESDLNVPYFCGNFPKCAGINDDWALEMAKNNVERFYPVVGILEELNATLEVLENKVPYFFKGVQNLYKQQVIEKFNRKQKIFIQPEIREDLRQVLKTEYEFYEWIKIRLFQQLQVLYGEHLPH